MKKRKNIMAKMVAFIALLAIVLSVIGTGLLIVISSWQEPEITQEQLQEYIDSLSGWTVTWNWEALIDNMIDDSE